MLQQINPGDRQTTGANPSEEYLQFIEAKNKRALEFLAKRNYETSQQYGQRISINRALGPFSLQEEELIKETEWNEVFIGKLPRDMFEDELLPIMERAGPIYRIRYMMDFSQSNRGFAFFQYVSRSDAVRAWARLDNFPVRLGDSRIGVKPSFDNKRLFFGNLHHNCTGDKLRQVLESLGIEGIERTHMADELSIGGGGCRGRGGHPGRRPGPNDFHANPRASRFCYVYFKTHEAATQARRKLLPFNNVIEGRRLTCDWAKSSIPEELVELKENIIKQRTPTNPIDDIINTTTINNNQINFNISNNINNNDADQINFNIFNNNNNNDATQINFNHHSNYLQSLSQLILLQQEQQQQQRLEETIAKAWPIGNLLS